MQTVEDDRGGHHAIRGKQSGDRAAAFGEDQRKIQQACLLDAAVQTGGTKAQRGGNTLRIVSAHAAVCIEGRPEF